MVRRYAVEAARRDILPEYRAIVTASAHMRAEYTQYGVAPDAVHVVDLMVAGADDPSDQTSSAAVDLQSSRPSLREEWRLLFIGRLTELKGPQLLLDALAHVRRQYRGRVHVVMIGDGDARADLEQRARSICGQDAGLSVQFAGWLEEADRAVHLREADLLVVPSVWPEPFGLVGPEAGLHGVPAVAFRLGGIPAWLEDGVNGHLAPGRLPRAKPLADAIVRSLADPAHHARLRAGAVSAARRFTLTRHLEQLLPVLERAAAR